MESGPDVRFLAQGSQTPRRLIGQLGAMSDTLFGMFPQGWYGGGARRSARLDWVHEAVEDL